MDIVCPELNSALWLGKAFFSPRPEGVGRGGGVGAFRMAVETYDSPLLTESDFLGFFWNWYSVVGYGHGSPQNRFTRVESVHNTVCASLQLTRHS